MPGNASKGKTLLEAMKMEMGAMSNEVKKNIKKTDC